MATFSDYFNNNGYTLLGDSSGSKEGSFAKIFRVLHNESNSIRAFKVLMQPILDEEDTNYKSFIREFEALKHLGDGGNPNIIRVYQLHRINDSIAAVEMEFVKGENLRDYLNANNNFIPYEEVLRMIVQISGALAYCHGKGIKHNDIHSANIMRRENGDFVLLDFGLAIKKNESGLTITRKKEGAPEYKAPEKWYGNEDPTTQSDIYSFGVVMYEYLAGVVPFSKNKYSDVELKEKHRKGQPDSISKCRQEYYKSKNTESSYVKDYPQWLEDVIFRCLEKNPNDRFKDGTELHKYILEHLIDDNGIGAGAEKSMGTNQVKETSEGKSRGWPWLITLIVLALVAILLWMLILQKGQSDTSSGDSITVSDDSQKEPSQVSQNNIDAVPVEKGTSKGNVSNSQDFVKYNNSSSSTIPNSEKNKERTKLNDTDKNHKTTPQTNKKTNITNDRSGNYYGSNKKKEFQEDTIKFSYGIYYGEYKIINGNRYPSGIGMMKYNRRTALRASDKVWHYRYVKAGYELAGIWEGETVMCGTLFDGSAKRVVLDSVPCK